nr:RNA-directed DNA polymerase, eukaryota [Tanacetum cinerariifolium]
MGFSKTKEDQVQRISTSVFVTNFPDHVGAKELWHACKQYGHVVDSFIPVRRSKAGKRFGFVRFMKVFDIDRWVGNLCTVWIGSHRLHANVARFSRPLVNSNKPKGTTAEEVCVNSDRANSSSAMRNNPNSYAHVLKGQAQTDVEAASHPVLVLDESCVNQKDFSHCLNGKVKEFGLLANLKLVMCNEGFSDVDFRCLDFEESSEDGSESGNSQSDDGFHGDIVGGEEDKQGEDDVSMVPNSMADKENNNDREGVEPNEAVEKNSADPFGIYSLLRKNRHKDTHESSCKESLKFPPGFTPREEGECDDSVYEPNGYDEVNSSVRRKKPKSGGMEYVGSGHFQHSEIPRSGLNPKTKKDWVRELCVSHKVNFLSLQETKMEAMNFFDIKKCWGNFAFEYAFSESIGLSGGILCIWNPSVLKNSSTTVSDYFVIVRGEWIPNGKSLLIISVYAPQEFTEKKMLWDYLNHVIINWKGEVIIMGDFNEVRYKNERFGSVFNVQGAKAFNSFIANLNLDEIPLGGCSYTWCHGSASKMNSYRIIVRSCYGNLIMIMGLFPFGFSITSLKWRTLTRLSMMLGAKTRQSITNRKRILQQELGKLDITIDNGKATEEDLLHRMEICNSIQDLDKLHIMEVAQKAKVKWAIEGDENSKFYHGILNKKRNQFAIRGVMKDSLWEEKPKVVLYLETEVSIEEIKKVVWDCGTDKAPGPDGFTFGFYKQFWGLIESDVVAAVKYFFQTGSFYNGCNSSFITLIPKIPDAKLVKDFRPISLIGSLYKIITKILANRIMLVLGDLVNEVQSEFVADRQILDGPFILNEVYQWCKEKKKQSFIWNVDFEKAYDSVRWDYLHDVLRKFGFGDRWCGWIYECLRTSRGSVLVNGSPTEEFQFFKVSKEKSGLGVSSLYALNRALIFKWVWRFKTQKDLLWTRVIKAIHADKGRIGVGSKVTRKSIWCDIVREVHAVKMQGFDILNYMQKKIGSGKDTFFWDDVWLGDTPLKYRFPRVYSLEVNKHVDVASKMSQVNL